MTPKGYPNVSLRFYELRRQAGMTQADVARALARTITTVGRWERGENRIPRKDWATICDALGVPREPYPAGYQPAPVLADGTPISKGLALAATRAPKPPASRAKEHDPAPMFQDPALPPDIAESIADRIATALVEQDPRHAKGMQYATARAAAAAGYFFGVQDERKRHRAAASPQGSEPKDLPPAVDNPLI